MKTTSHLAAALSSANPGRHSRRSLRRAAQETQLSTTDVTFVSPSARAGAIRKGAGVMIGDYFVGLTTASDLLYSHPVIVY